MHLLIQFYRNLETIRGGAVMKDLFPYCSKCEFLWHLPRIYHSWVNHFYSTFRKMLSRHHSSKEKTINLLT